MVSVFFISFEKYELGMRKNISTFFHFFPEKTQYEKKLCDVSF